MKMFQRVVCLFILLSAQVHADSSFYGFIDTYYMWDFNSSTSRQRSHTTQPIKHDTFSTNLAMIGGKYQTEKFRSVLTLQAGDSVDANYSPETKSGQAVKHLQEAYAGIKAGDVWIDGGIYLGHIGNESWISGLNWNYSRSLQLDYVPYYTSGLRISGEHGKNNWQIHLMNGWQRINENNQGKAIGTSYVWNFTDYTLTYNTQVGHEIKPGSNTSGLRTYQNLHLDRPGKMIDWRVALDIGTQNEPGKNKALVWGASSSQWRYRYSEKVTFASRVEYFHDARGAVNFTARDGNSRVAGASINSDYKFENAVTLRMELRHLQAADPVFENNGRSSFSDTFLVSSLSYMF